jgi:ABC-type branched-subunit amino acid transport system ATPase component
MSTSPAQPVVLVAGAKRFGSVEVVNDLSFEVAGGEVLGFLGPNGAGKTTMMRMILDIIRPDAGRIEVFGGARRGWPSSTAWATCPRSAGCTATCRRSTRWPTSAR